MIVCLLCCHVSDCVIRFPQRVDEPLDVAGEEPSPATEDLTQDSLPVKASQLSKLNPMSCIFTFLNIMYLLFMYYYIRVGIIVVVLGQAPPTLYLSGISELEQPWWICVLLSHCYPSTCTCRITALLDWSCPDQPYAYTYARPVATLDVWLAPYKWPWGCTFLQL